MKKMLVLSAIAGLLLQELTAQANIVPPKVSAAFTVRYPTVTAPHWKPDKTGYEAAFHAGNRARHAYYAPDGGWIRTETRIKWTKNLPPAVRQGLRNSPYVSWYVESMRETESADRHVVTIDVSQVIDYRMGGLYKDVYRLCFSMDGKLMKTEKVS
jgi:hypothetical protein